MDVAWPAVQREQRGKSEVGLWILTTPPPPPVAGTLLTCPEIELNLKDRVVSPKNWRIRFDFIGRWFIVRKSVDIYGGSASAFLGKEWALWTFLVGSFFLVGKFW